MFKKLLLCSTLILITSSGVQALTDYASPNSDYEGEYKSTHNDITTVGQSEKEPSLDQAGELREKNLEEMVKPKVDPKPDLDPAQPEDQMLMNKIENGDKLAP